MVQAEYAYVFFHKNTRASHRVQHDGLCKCIKWHTLFVYTFVNRCDFSISTYFLNVSNFILLHLFHHSLNIKMSHVA